MEDLIAKFTTQSWWVWVVCASTCASAIAAATPTPKEGSTLAKLYRLIDWLALNIGKAKDKGAPADAVKPEETKK